jgi:hypothetical protein
MGEEGYGPKEIGDYFKRSKGTVAHAVKKMALTDLLNYYIL